MPFPELPPLISEALVEQGYAEPTAVQAAVLEPEARGRDLIVSAQTGSGKTVAFGLAMAERLLEVGATLARAGAPLALVIAPTRELARQVSRELNWLYGKAGGRITTCVGGMNAALERKALAQGSHIVVGTPGRLRDHLERGALDLSGLQYVVLDEADEMLDMGFRDDLEEILDATPGERRTLLFSATMPKPIVALAKRYQQDALRVSTVGEDRGHGDISYKAVAVSPSDIEHAVINLLRFHEAETAILFCATRDNVRHLHASLVERGFAAVALSGEHSQNERNHALQALRDGRARVCVATDVAARGIDIASLSLVIHVEVPRDPEVLQHRSGRTGRAGKKGTAVLIVPFQRRRRVEMMLRHARVEADWVPVPTPEMIRKQDQERLFAAITAPAEASEQDEALAARILEKMSPADVALALIAAHRSRMPEPEELIDLSQRDAGARSDHHRPGFDDTVWFRMDIGRRQNADPRWLLPLLCRRGHITRNEIGAIRIATHETFFQVPRAIEAKFSAAVKRTANPGAEDESGIVIELAPDSPRDAARDNARQHKGGPHPSGQRPGGHDGPRGPRKHKATPYKRAGKPHRGKG
ncbi:MAG: DEAD/DEAH box helicase [Novosphingobium sp.]